MKDKLKNNSKNKSQETNNSQNTNHKQNKEFVNKKIHKIIDRKDNYENDENTYDDIVEGRNSVIELLKTDRDINKIFIQNGEKHGSINKIIAVAKEKKVIIKEVEKSKLDFMSKTKNHQGVIAVVSPFNYCDVDEILEEAKNKNEDPFIILLDGIEDPHNLGSIIRTAETAGVHGIIIPKKKSCICK